MDLLLTHGYFLNEDPKELQIMRPYVPLGILYLTSYLRRRHFNVEVFDSTFSTRAQLNDFLGAVEPSVLGIYANLMTRRSVLHILKVAREAGWKTVVGGPEPGAYVEEYLDAGADVVVIGEGEATMEELLPCLRSGTLEQLGTVHGIAFRDEHGMVQRTVPRALIPNIDALPWPSRDAVRLELYVETWRKHHHTGSVSLITARGCPYECRWCSHAVYGKTHRRRKPVAVVDELEWILDRYSPDMLWIADDVFTIHHGWLAEFAAEMTRRNIRVPFECISRADRLNAQAADLLASLNCFRIWIGSESGSQRILDAMDRGVTVEEVHTAVELCRSRGIQTGMFLMWGYEGEEIADIEATIDHVKRVRPGTVLTTVSYPIKGTPYFEEVAERVLSPTAWADGSDRDFRIRGRHSRRFYKHADELLKAEMDLDSFVNSPSAEASLRIIEMQARVSQARSSLQSTFDELEA